MSFRHAAAVSRAPIAALALVGVVWGGFASLVPDIKAAAGASDQQFGLALIMSALGGMCATYMVPRVGQMLGRLAMPVIGVFLLLAFFYPLFAHDLFSLGVALFLMGASVAMLDITSNVRISVLETRYGLHLMNLNHAMFSFGFAGAAFVTGLARKSGIGAGEILPVLSLVSVVLVVLMWESEASYGKTPENAEPAQVGIRPPWIAIILTGVILFAAFVGENSTEAWSALHIERTLGAAAGVGGYGPTTLGMVMGFARLSGQLAAEKFGEARLIFWSAICGSIGSIIIGAAPTQASVLFGVGVVGLGMAVVVPSVNSILGRLVREDQRAFAISRAWMFGMFGFFVGPSMMGLISQYFGLRVAFFVVSVVIAVMIPAILALARQEKA